MSVRQGLSPLFCGILIVFIAISLGVGALVGWLIGSWIAGALAAGVLVFISLGVISYCSP